MDPQVRQELAAHDTLLEQFGPQLRRPYADTLNGSRYANMKELRFTAADGVWRTPLTRNARPFFLWPAISADRAAGAFTNNLIANADAWFAAHLAALKKRGG